MSNYTKNNLDVIDEKQPLLTHYVTLLIVVQKCVLLTQKVPKMQLTNHHLKIGQKYLKC